MRLTRRLRYLVGRASAERELLEELETHRLMTEQRLLESGMSAADAAAQSRRLMGNVTLAREDAREQWLAPWLESVWKDVRYALRHLRAHPAFSITAGATLVLAISLNTSVFTVFNAMFLRPWPVRVADRVVLVNSVTAETGDRSAVTLADFQYFREHARSFAGMALVGGSGGRISTAPGPDFDYVQTGFVSGGFFEALGVPMAIGRGFSLDEDIPGSPRAVVVIGAGLWERGFGRDPQILGRTIYLNNRPVTVVGVTAPEATGPWPFVNEAWIPMASAMAVRGRQDCCIALLAGTLAPGVSRQAARSELTVLMRQLDQAARRKPRTVLVTGTRPIEQAGTATRAAPYALFLGALLVVLLLACANVGNLQLARALARRRELSIRLSLGAGRARIVRQLLTETLLLAIGAGAIALVASYVVPAAVLRELGDPFRFPLTPDATVLAFAMILCGAATIVTGLAPALTGTRDAADFTAVQRGALGVHRPMLRALLLSVQIALSAALLFAASILTRGLVHASTSDPGYDIEGVTVATVTLPAGAYDAPRSAALLSELKDALAASGVGPVGSALPLPLEPSSLIIDVRRPQDAPDDVRTVHLRPLSADAFKVLGIPVVAGRVYDDSAAAEVMVNETFARRFWPDGDAVGQRLYDRNRTLEVVGIVRDVHFTDLNAIEPVLHFPRMLATVPPLLVRTDAAGVAQMQALVKRLEPRATVTATPLVHTVRQSLQASYTSVAVSWVLGILALTLATVGVFGVFSYIVEERAREIAIRMALGARRAQVVGLMFRSTRVAVLGGLAAALILSLVAGRALRAFLFGLNPLDPVAYLAAAAVLGVAATVATAIPVRRAMRVDPVALLRLD